MRYAGIDSDIGVLDFYKVAYLYSAVQMSARAQMHKRTRLRSAVYFAVVRLNIVQCDIIFG